jgi:hypothetical protein
MLVSGDIPVIGVVSSVSPDIRKARKQNILRPSPYYCMMAEYVASQNAQFMLFSPKAVNWSAQNVDAWVPQNPTKPLENWHRKRMPLPDSMYENVFVHLAIQGYAASLRKMAKEHQIPVFNPALPGKWLMARWLMKSNLAKYQPETLLLPAPKIALSYIRDWSTVYVKPGGGYGGMGVARIEQMPHGEYRISIDRPGLNTRKVRMVLSESELVSWLRGKQKSPHLLQRGLNLCEVNQCKIDFRVVTHRDGNGKWNLVGIIPKIAAKDGVVTNIIAGGKVVQLAELERLANGEGWQVPVSQISICALEIAKLLSAKVPNTGILGFDIGVEKNNRVSMIEMNPKPARSLLTKDMKIESAKFASGFSLYLARK